MLDSYPPVWHHALTMTTPHTTTRLRPTKAQRAEYRGFAKRLGQQAVELIRRGYPVHAKSLAVEAAHCARLGQEKAVVGKAAAS